MKNPYILLIAMFVILLSSCYRSQFSTTTRDYKNGKVRYANHYHTEKSKISKGAFHKHQLKEPASPTSTFSSSKEDVRISSEPEITKINPASISSNENLIASTSIEPTLIAARKDQMVSVNDLILSLKKHYRFNVGNSFPDTIKRNVTKKGTTNDSITQQVVKFKNGQKETVKIISQSHDTLKYHLINEPDVVRTVTKEQVDTILQVKSLNPKAKIVDTRKNEPLGIAGLVCSILGLFPFFGIPFAILAISFGAASLGRLRRYPERFKGKKTARASLIIGIVIHFFMHKWLKKIVSSYIIKQVLK